MFKTGCKNADTLVPLILYLVLFKDENENCQLRVVVVGSTGGDIANIINIFLQTIININCVAISQIGCKFTNFDILCFMIIQEQQNFYTQDISKFPEECLFSECWIDSKEKTFCNISPCVCKLKV